MLFKHYILIRKSMSLNKTLLSHSWIELEASFEGLALPPPITAWACWDKFRVGDWPAAVTWVAAVPPPGGENAVKPALLRNVVAAPAVCWWALTDVSWCWCWCWCWCGCWCPFTAADSWLLAAAWKSGITDRWLDKWAGCAAAFLK